METVEIEVTIKATVPVGRYCGECEFLAYHKGNHFESGIYPFCGLIPNTRLKRENGNKELKCPQCLDACKGGD